MLTKALIPVTTLAVAGISGLSIIHASRQPNDFQTLAQLRTELNKAPEIKYPEKDIRGRTIPKFDYLVVLTSCKSCSQFRSQIRPVMAEKPDKVWLIATPDRQDIADFAKHDNYYIVDINPGSKLSYIPAGAYAR